jgi:hypothetical protein
MKNEPVLPTPPRLYSSVDECQWQVGQLPTNMEGDEDNFHSDIGNTDHGAAVV